MRKLHSYDIMSKLLMYKSIVKGYSFTGYCMLRMEGSIMIILLSLAAMTYNQVAIHYFRMNHLYIYSQLVLRD